MEGIELLGHLVSDLPTATADETPLTALPPLGASRLIEEQDNAFRWQPISTEDWNRMPAAERGQVILDRGIAWLKTNGDLCGSPVAFVSPGQNPESIEQIFGRSVSTLVEAICATYTLMKQQPVQARVIVASLGVTLALISGIPPAHLAAEGIEVLLTLYGERVC